MDVESSETSKEQAPSTDALFTPIDAASLGFFRFGFGVIMLVEMLHYILDGLVQSLYVDATFHFKFYGFGWVEALPEAGMFALFWSLVVLALLIAVGLFYRVSIFLFGLGFTYVFLLDKTYYLNHFYLISLLCLILVFVPADRAFSLRRLRKPDTPRTLPVWCLWLLRFQLGLVYFLAGAAKLNADWLRGEPMRSMAYAGESILSPGFPAWAQNDVVVYIGAYGGLLFDLFVTPFLLWRKTRMIAFLFACAFHLGNFFVFRLPIGIFPWYMIVATTLFFDPDWPRQVIGWWRRRRGLTGPEPVVTDPTPVVPSPLRRKLILGLGGLYIVVQILLPLRHNLYPGNPSWTNEGNDFAWRMMIFAKDPEARFYATDPDTGKVWQIDAEEYLTPYQALIMPLRPDMILQFCHHAANDLRAKGHERVEIRGYVKATLNGRRPQLLINPFVDLAAEPRSLAHKPWIQPLTVPFEERQFVSPDPKMRSGWAAFEPGAWILADERLSLAGKTASFRRLRTLQLRDQKRYIRTENISKIPLDAGGDIVLPVTPGALPEDLDMRVQTVDHETLEIDGVKVACKVTAYTMSNSDDPWQARLVLWTTDTFRVPYREVPDVQPRLLRRMAMMPNVVKLKYVVMDQMSRREGIYEVQVEALQESFSLGERTLECVRESARIARRGQGGEVLAKMERWLSTEVPNHIVKATVNTAQPKRTTEWGFSIVKFSGRAQNP